MRDARAGRLLLSLDGHTDFVSPAAMSADGERTASSSADGTVKIWSIKERRILATFLGGPAWRPAHVHPRRTFYGIEADDRSNPARVSAWDRRKGEAHESLVSRSKRRRKMSTDSKEQSLLQVVEGELIRVPREVE